MKIEKLTKKQEKLVPVYRDKWLAVGRSTKRLNRKKAIEAVKTIYRCAGKEEPKHFHFYPSPIQCQLAINIMKSKDFEKITGDLLKGSNLSSNLGSNLRANLGSNLWSNLWSNLGSNLGSNLSSNLRDNLWDNLRDNLESNLGDNLGSNLRDNLWDNLRDNLRDNLGANLWDNLRANLRANLWDNLRDNLRANLGDNLGANLRDNLKTEYSPMYCGSMDWDIGWTGFYDFVLNELFEDRIKEFKSFIEYLEAMKNIHVFIPFNDIVFISDRPAILSVNSQGRLHGDLKPAMNYSDGYSLFYLNGIKVPKELVLMKASEITKDTIIKEANADIRREAIRKLGSEQLLKVLDYKVLDKMDDYELITFDIGDGRVRPWLKMINPSDKKLVHVEGVKPEIDTVKKAITYRNGLTEFEAPIALS